MEEQRIQNNADAKSTGKPSFGKALISAYKRHCYRYSAWDQREYRLFVRVVGTVTTVSLLAATIWFGRKAIRGIEERLDMKKADVALAHADYSQAMKYVNQALALNPYFVPACRMMADLNDGSRLPSALFWRERTASLSPTLENKLLLARAGLYYQSEPYALTAQILKETGATASTNAIYEEVSGNLAFDLHHYGEAESHLEAACKLDPTNEEYALELALLHLSSAQGVAKIQARKAVEKLGSVGVLRPTALRTLIADTMAEQKDQEALTYSTELVAASQATLADQLQNLEILQRLNSSQLPARLITVEHITEKDPGEVAQLSDWMRTHDMVSQNIEWLNALPENMITRPVVQSSLGRSYLQSGNWQAFIDYSTHGDWGDMDYLRLALMSHAWSQLGTATLADSNWSEAVRKGSDRYDSITNLLGLAEQWQLKPQVKELRRRMQQFAPSGN